MAEQRNYGTLYVVAGERNIVDGIVNFANVGFTTRSVCQRLCDNDYSRKNAGGRWKIICEIPLTESVSSDKPVHHRLQQIGFEMNPDDTKNSEEFEFMLSEIDVISYVKKAFAMAHPSYKSKMVWPTSRQDKARDKACKFFREGRRQFRINGPIRSETRMTALWTMKNMGFRKTLVVTNNGEDHASWKDDVLSHNDFIIYHHVDVSMKPAIITSMNNIVCTVSLGDINKYDWIRQIDWHLVIMDSVMETSLENIPRKHELVLSQRVLSLSH